MIVYCFRECHVQVSKDRKTWKDIECGKTFTANSDMFSKVTNMFDNPVLATYVRILPQTWYGWMSMRAGLLLCERPCIDHKLDYPMVDSLLSITRGNRSHFVQTDCFECFFGRSCQYALFHSLVLKIEENIFEEKIWTENKFNLASRLIVVDWQALAWRRFGGMEHSMQRLDTGIYCTYNAIA